MQENKEDRRASGIKTYGTVKENLKAATYSTIGLVVSFGIMVFVAKSGIVYNMMMGVAAFSAISLIFTLCKALLLFIKGKTKPSINKESGEKQRHKVKVIPVKIGSDKQEGKAKQAKEEQQENEKQVVSVKSVKKNPISLYVFIILFVVASVVCVWQAAQLSAARDDVTTLQGTVSAAEAKIKVQASEIKKQNRIIDGLYDQIDKLHGEVNRLLGYRKYLTAADIEDLERSYQESLDETREITRKYG